MAVAGTTDQRREKPQCCPACGATPVYEFLVYDNRTVFRCRYCQPKGSLLWPLEVFMRHGEADGDVVPLEE